MRTTILAAAMLLLTVNVSAQLRLGDKNPKSK